MASSSIRVAYSSSLFRLPPAPLSSPPLALHFTSISLPSSHSSSSIRSIRTLPKRGSSLVMGAPSSSFLDSFNAEEVTSLTVLRADSGEPVQFNDLWDQNDGMAVVALLRHFGCICCWELASLLRDVKPRFDSAGVKLIAVGVATPDKAQRLPFPLDCLYADPDREGGMFIFKGKQLIYARKDGGTGDHAPLEDILNLCCTTPAV